MRTRVRAHRRRGTRGVRSHDRNATRTRLTPADRRRIREQIHQLETSIRFDRNMPPQVRKDAQTLATSLHSILAEDKNRARTHTKTTEYAPKAHLTVAPLEVPPVKAKTTLERKTVERRKR